MLQTAQQSALGMHLVRMCVLTRHAKQALARLSSVGVILTSKPTLNYACRDFPAAMSSRS